MQYLFARLLVVDKTIVQRRKIHFAAKSLYESLYKLLHYFHSLLWAGLEGPIPPNFITI